MSNITLFQSGAALPDYLRSEPDALTRALAGSNIGKSISIRGGVWRLNDGGTEIAKNTDRAMNIVILAAAPTVSRTFYAGKYVEGVDAPPACWSADGKTPNPEVPAESRQASNCATCKNNIEGSGEGKSRACRYQQRFAVALENDISGGVYRLQLPAKSLFGKAEGDKMHLQAYAKFLAGHGVPITGVVTEARFDTDEAVPVLLFKAIRPLSKDEWDAAKAQSTTDDAAQAVEFKMVVKANPEAINSSPSTVPYAEPTKPAKAAPAPVAVIEDEDDEEPVAAVVAEPVKRAKKPEPVAAPTKDVSSVLAAWADDDED